MTDRELLELAAKVAEVHSGFINEHGGGKTFCWNPLLDDGDALRLAVTLNLTVHATTMAGFAELEEKIFIRQACLGSDRPDYTPAEAIRRAIVRAAAEIGRAMP